MKNKRANFLSTLIRMILICGMLFTIDLSAQTPPGGSTGVDDTGKTDSIPIDGGLAVLILGATALGISRIRANKLE